MEREPTHSGLHCGSGSLTDVDLTSVTVPEGVEITDISVKINQAVQAGDIRLIDNVKIK